MKNGIKLRVLCAMLSVLMLTACGATTGESASESGEEQSTTTAAAATEYSWDFAKKTTDIDELKSSACDEQGTVVTLEYDTPAYAVNDLFDVDETIHKTLNIYLPYGYDESQQYNVVYLLHGTAGENDGAMEDYWLVQWGEYTCNLLDNMIQQGLCEPVIVVTPTYYSEVDGYEVTDEMMEELAEESNDSYIHTEESEDGNEVDNPQNAWTLYFGEELRNNIIPAVESAYSTYADGDVSEENLIATREHRAFAGLSRGSMTVMRSGLMVNTDIIAYFGNYSGIWSDAEQLQSVLEDEFADCEIKFWYNGNGRGDFALEDHQTFVEEALSLLGDSIVDGENYAWVRLTDGSHSYSSWLTHLYNSLLVFFQ